MLSELPIPIELGCLHNDQDGVRLLVPRNIAMILIDHIFNVNGETLRSPDKCLRDFFLIRRLSSIEDKTLNKNEFLCF